MKETQKIIKETTTSIIDDDGVHLKSEYTKKVVVPKEPQYIKLYLQDVMYLKDLPKWSNQILYCLLKIMNYENKIFLNAELKKEIAEQLNIKAQTINDAITSFTKSKILIRFGSSSYIANPMLFGKGEWLGIRKIRLTVEYDFELGTKEFTAEIETETNKVEHEIE